MRLIEFINAGGSITWILVAMNVVGLSVICWRVIIMRAFKAKLADEAKIVARDISSLYKTI